MKKKFKLLTLGLMLVVCALVFCSCNLGDDGDQVSSIQVITDSYDVEIGSFSYDNYSIQVSYESGKIEKVPMTEDMISDVEFLKLYTYGPKEINISAYGKECVLSVNVTRKQIKDVYIQDFEYDSKLQTYKYAKQYDGVPYVIQIAGDIPAGTTITYPNGQEFTQVGSFDFVVYISCENYETKKLLGNITIRKAVYDLSGVQFEGEPVKMGFDTTIYQKTVDYNGDIQSMSLIGDLPEGVKVSYSIASTKTGESNPGNSAIDAGNYYIYANFDADTTLHEPISPMTAFLVINKAEIDLTGITLEDQEVPYTGDTYEFKLTNEELLLDREGKLYPLVDFEYENNLQSNAGVYIVKALFTAKDSTNYKVTPSITAKVKINKANYDMSNVIFDNKVFKYDGLPHEIKIELLADTNLPFGVQVSYQGNQIVDAGLYTVAAVFTHTNPNYEQIPNMEAALRIDKGTIDTSGCIFDIENAITYDGNSYSPELLSIPDTIKKVEYQYSYKIVNDLGVYEDHPVETCMEAREYTLSAIFTEVDSNYEIPEPFNFNFTINPITISSDQLHFADQTLFIYDGQKHFVELIDPPYDAAVTYIPKDSETSAIGDGITPGNYRQAVSLKFFNGLEEVVFKPTLEKEFTILFEISKEDIIYNPLVRDFDGETTAPIFEWNPSSPNYDLLIASFNDISYFYKPFGAGDNEYLKSAPVAAGEYDCKAIFPSCLTGKDGGKLFEFVNTKLTINKAEIHCGDVLNFLVNGESNNPVFLTEFQYKNGLGEIVDTEEVYVQTFNMLYSGKSLELTQNAMLSSFGRMTYKCYYGIGDNKIGDYEYHSSDSFSHIENPGKYVYKISFVPDANNCSLRESNEMFVVINFDRLYFDENMFATQPVQKGDIYGKEFDRSGIPSVLNPTVKYSYDNGVTFDTKAKVYEEAGVESYHVYLTLTIDVNDVNIDKNSFDAAAITGSFASVGIEEIIALEPIDRYQSYQIKIKVDYVD